MADDKFAYELNDAAGLTGRKIWSHLATELQAESIDTKNFAIRGYTQSATVPNNNTVDITIGNRQYDNWVKIIIVAYRGASLGYRKWELEIINDNSSISTSNIYVQNRIGGSNFGLTFTNLFYSSNNINLTLSADNRSDDITVRYKTEVVNFNSTDNDFTIY